MMMRRNGCYLEVNGVIIWQTENNLAADSLLTPFIYYLITVYVVHLIQKRNTIE
jgi:hypothetical protein